MNHRTALLLFVLLSFLAVSCAAAGKLTNLTESEAEILLQGRWQGHLMCRGPHSAQYQTTVSLDINGRVVDFFLGSGERWQTAWFWKDGQFITRIAWALRDFDLTRSDGTLSLAASYQWWYGPWQWDCVVSVIKQ